MSLDEVAKRAKVSPATVSRVLNNVGSVKTSTRARVIKAVQELKYHTNVYASTLAGGKSRTLGMIVSNLENPFFLDIFRAAESDAHAHGFEIVLANTDYKADQLARSIRLMIARRVAGLAIIVSEMDPQLTEELSHNKIPVVFFDVASPTPGITNIKVNYSRGIQKGVEYLHDLGHRRMTFIGHHATLGPLSIREQVFRNSVQGFGGEVEWTVATNIDGLEGGRAAVREVLGSGFAPTAIVCVNDMMALGVLRELRERGLRVPEDVSVIGFDNIKLSEYSFPTLTTLHIARDKIGHLAFESLHEHATAQSGLGREFLIDPDFMVRNSTGPAPR
jgi:LacI family transcriptional regulator, galactose operon repressor